MNTVVLIQRVAAAADCVSSLSTHCVRAMVLATVSAYRVRHCVSQRSPVCRSWMRLLARPPCCHAAGRQRTVDTAVSIQCEAADADCVSSLSTRCVRARVQLLPRRVALDVASVDVRLSVGRGCVSLLVHSAVMRLVVSGRRCDCVRPVCSCRMRRRVLAMVLLMSRRLVLVAATVNVCLSVGR